MVTQQQGAIVKQQANIDELAMDVAGYYFDVIQEHSISLNSHITDNYMENNVAISDHIANEPIIINVSGIAGELVYVPNIEEQNEVLEKAKRASGQTIIQKLGKLSVLYPPFDNFTQKYINAANYIEASVNRYTGVVTQFFNSNRAQAFQTANPNYESKIRKIYDRFETMRLQKLPFEVETPYRTFKNMYIQSLTLRQGNILYTTDIQITFKQAYFLDTLTTKADEKVKAKYNQYQRAEIENHGKVQGPKSSIIGDMISKFRGDKYYTYNR